jgi:hypothetical protein
VPDYGKFDKIVQEQHVELERMENAEESKIKVKNEEPKPFDFSMSMQSNQSSFMNFNDSLPL